ncbi:Lrp/AsnC family transcriptional regulator [Sphingobium sp. HBC34]|uniref:Lrp/AsnC family transcriptional regulator n=1 Tax=Sphingobium cyanobacteriorum TaxID=3063954 RepID=A0ABT8ZLM9_9SPHN|nr:Lrp/AsnC family transcriptional regulator [Sphingobium sp. HBC34]MDO7835452.1 Lrp/AsnC family transcriptional regulator [Sphingobium sp. HBC34]
MSAADLDHIDLGIIALLQGDAKRSNREIAVELKLSEITVAARIRSLHERNVLRIILQRDISEFQAHAMVDILVEGRSPADVASDLASIDQVVAVILAIGQPDIVLHLYAENLADLLDMMERDVATIDGVTGYEVMPIGNILKLDKRLGVLDR